MLKLLLKKQIMEVFKSSFYDAKKKKQRSKKGIIIKFLIFFLLMYGLIGGSMFWLCTGICEPLTTPGYAWVYFDLMTLISILLGVFGSVFNTYTGLYLSKDNDLLLSLPIDQKYIIASRLLNVYLLGTMYSSIILLPTIIVYWITVGLTITNLLCGILLLVIVSLFVLVLTCILGYIVARVSLKLKNKSYITTIISLVFIGIYYYFYAQAGTLIRELITNIYIYGEEIKGSAYALYVFGKVGTGDIISTLICFGIVSTLASLTYFVLAKSFIKIVTTSASYKGSKTKQRNYKDKSTFGALLSKEFSRFTTSSSYMLNRGFGIIMIPASGILLLLKGSLVIDTINQMFVDKEGAVCILLVSLLLILLSTADTVSCSVSLEGNNIWVLQSLPVHPKMILRAKAIMNLILLLVPTIFTTICILTMIDTNILIKLLVFVLAVIFAIFYVLICLYLGIKFVNLSWTNEIVPIKQSICSLFTIFGDWIVVCAFAALYLFVGYKIGIVVYLSVFIVILIALSLMLLKYLDTKGAKIFSEL